MNILWEKIEIKREGGNLNNQKSIQNIIFFLIHFIHSLIPLIHSIIIILTQTKKLLRKYSFTSSTTILFLFFFLPFFFKFFPFLFQFFSSTIKNNNPFKKHIFVIFCYNFSISLYF